MQDLLRNHYFATHAVAAATSVTISNAITYPLDTVKTLIQVNSKAKTKVRAGEVVKQIQSISGNSGLYYGFGSSILGRILGVGARFGVFELVTAFYKDGRGSDHIFVSEAFMAGIASGLFEGFISAPFELIKLRQQMYGVSHLTKTPIAPNLTSTSSFSARSQFGYSPHKNAWDRTLGLVSTLPTKNSDLAGTLKKYPWLLTGSGKPPAVYEVRTPQTIIALEGYLALWRGVRSTIVRDCVFGGVFFSCWQYLQFEMMEINAMKMGPPLRSYEELVDSVSPLATSIAAGVSGSVAGASSHVFDTAKSRSQSTVIPKYISKECNFLKQKLPRPWYYKLADIHPSDRNILFRGISLRAGRSGFASFAIVGSYLLAVDLLVAK